MLVIILNEKNIIEIFVRKYDVICQVSIDSWKTRRIYLKNYFDKYGYSIILIFAIAAFYEALCCITVIYDNTYLEEFLKYIKL